MEPECGALVEPMAVGFSAIRRANIKKTTPVFIMGAGPVGLSVALWCQFLVLENVVISDRLEERCNAALNFGATAVANQGGGHISEQIFDLLGGPPILLFDCLRLQGTLQMAIDNEAPNSRIIVIGLCMQLNHYFPAKAL